ncbi:exopolyphosphatase/guanosine-5'-triphosphate,3'-diphosphate pyrophosphatase [Microbacterium resistens]|uniref:Exopolyphosphatase/guanosine-5'-triphosphate, 3'-diphosphate pyrophosphatase n=1 Tax=Microbacterium resistens TaxID=156977 RepID=A0ABU1SCF5_9MICO|nr:Ppx/GppA phosphatase family protein [Microbacterium resistens]MDR6867266.1 exopolyphosphatase/guanosine-5'-triphosphate,3'-diphosphate pyrophosphatase [Microbacterium resistens]
MRLGVLDIGSNTVHLLAADVHPGGRPLATTSDRTIVRLMRYLTPAGAISEEGVVALVSAVAQARRVAEHERVDALLATATSAVREAANGAEVIARIEEALGQELQVLDGETEARLTFLAVRRWFGWAAGRILLFDIGGGSLELATGAEELPDLAASVPLGAGRMTVQFLPDDPPGEEAVEHLRAHAAETIAPIAAAFTAQERPDHVAGSSKAIRSLARLVGYPAAGRAGAERVLLPRASLGSWIPRLARLPASARQELPGITPDRTFQIVAAAVALHTAMTAMRVDELEVSPWALREGVLLRYIEHLEWDVQGNPLGNPLG